jgi:hypothetical protein
MSTVFDFDLYHGTSFQKKLRLSRDEVYNSLSSINQTQSLAQRSMLDHCGYWIAWALLTPTTVVLSLL